LLRCLCRRLLPVKCRPNGMYKLPRRHLWKLDGPHNRGVHCAVRERLFLDRWRHCLHCMPVGHLVRSFSHRPIDKPVLGLVPGGHLLVGWRRKRHVSCSLHPVPCGSVHGERWPVGLFSLPSWHMVQPSYNWSLNCRLLWPLSHWHILHNFCERIKRGCMHELRSRHLHCGTRPGGVRGMPSRQLLYKRRHEPWHKFGVLALPRWELCANTRVRCIRHLHTLRCWAIFDWKRLFV
jgi:hypothetical protein